MSYKKTILLLCLGIFLSTERYANAQTASFNYTGSLQTWVVPACVTQATITATGGQGNASTGGMGASISGTFNVTPGHVINVIVAQAGISSGDDYDGGGGGGSFVWDNNTTTLLVAAGGGGGDLPVCGGAGGPGSATTTPTAGGGGNGSAAGGSGGNGGSAGSGNGSAGGCGWLSNGANGSGSPISYGGNDPANGAAGGAAGGYYGGNGGYGGGGGNWESGCGSSGGGGGYNGGGGGNNDDGAGGGGGSYNGGTNQNNVAGANSGNGSVSIVYVTNVLTSATGKVITNVSCNGGSNGEAAGVIVGTGISSFTYSWAPSGGSTDTANGLTAGSYTLSVNDACGNSATAAITITQPTAFSASAVATANVLCHGGDNAIATAVVTGSAPFTYIWSDANLQTTQAATGLTAGTYTVGVVDACGASATTSITITQPNAIAVSASATGNVICNTGSDGSALTTVSGGAVPYTYAWSDANSQVTASATGLVAGGYTVNVWDNNGCTGSARVTITQPTVLGVSIGATSNIECNGAHTGGASSTVAGGTGPYTYAWTAGGGNGANSSTLGAGIDTVVVVDSHGCTASAVTTITQPEALNVIRNATVDHGSCTAAAWVVVGGGNAPYTYAWSNNANMTDFISGLCKGSYCCTVTDHSGCTDSVCITVNSDLGVGNINGNTAQITVYPNPNSGQFTIQSAAVNGASSVEIYNILGEKVYSTSIAANKGGATTINISNQPNGIYLYRVISNDNGSLLGQGKVILQK